MVSSLYWEQYLDEDQLFISIFGTIEDLIGKIDERIYNAYHMYASA
jgi:hypothetical protein